MTSGVVPGRKGRLHGWDLKLRTLLVAIAFAFGSAALATTAMSSPYNFFEPSAEPAVSQPEAPARSKRPVHDPQTHAKPAAHGERKNARAADGPKGATTRTPEGGPIFGSPSLGVETSPTIKQRSLSGDVADPERDLNICPVRQNWLPSFLGLSLKAPFSW
jgi:hypothetical protein